MKSLVSIIIPTRNSGETIGTCLTSIRKQTWPNIEVIVVDSYSSDGTREIAQKFDVKIVVTREKLLAARYKGLKESESEYVLLLDSDQILDHAVIARALEMFKEYDMLCLEEHSYRPKTWIQRLHEADRCLVHNLANVHLDPLDGVLLARFYRRGVLRTAFEAIPKEIMPAVVAHDHAIIYYEAYKISQKVGVLPKAVWHIEPASLVRLWKKNYRYGKTTKDLVKKHYYRNLLRSKVRFRKGALNFGNLKYGIPSCLLTMLKGVAYQIGCWAE
ncbi:MAG: glycosyltransferase family 2 protein [Candidatus Hodarchaeota archaeon]